MQVAAQRAGGTAPAPARLRDVHVVAINSSEDADTAATVLGVVRRTAATIAGLRPHADGGRDDHQAHGS